MQQMYQNHSKVARKARIEGVNGATNGAEGADLIREGADWGRGQGEITSFTDLRSLSIKSLPKKSARKARIQ